MKNRYSFLDLFRVVAALLVLLVHARCETFETYSQLIPESQNMFTQIFYVIANLGLDSVAVFFLLSGFLTGGRAIQNFKNGKISPKQYVLGRVARIYPPLIATLLLIIVSNFFIHKDFSWMMILGNLFGLQHIAVNAATPVLWTIAYEIWFYVFIWGLMLFMNKKYLFTGIFIMSIASTMFIGLSIEWVLMLFIGMLAYYYKDNKIQRGVLLIALAVFFCTFCLDFLSKESHAFNTPFNGWNRSMIFFWFGVSLMVIITKCAMSAPSNKFLIALDSFGSKLAPISYSLFLTHLPALYVLRYLRNDYVYEYVNLSSMGVYILNCIICIIVGWLMYWLVERHTGKIQKALFKLFKV